MTYRRMGRAPRKELAVRRRLDEPTLVAYGHVAPIVDENGDKIGERPLEQPALRLGRQRFREAEHRPASNRRRRRKAKLERCTRIRAEGNVIVDDGRRRGILIDRTSAGSSTIRDNRIIGGRGGRAG